MAVNLSLQELGLVLIEKACILVALAFLLTRTRLFPNLGRLHLSAKEQAMASALFLALGLVEVLATLQHPTNFDSPMNLRIVAVCAAGLIAGPWVGVFIGFAVTVLATLYGNHPPLPIAISMVLAGAAGGALRLLRPDAAVLPTTGFLLGVVTSFLRDGVTLLLDGRSPSTADLIIGSAALHGLSVALILLVIEQSAAQETHARAAALAEIRALQARMNPHFLFNSLNTLSALSELDPRSVPRAAAFLGTFLRASLDQNDRPFYSLREELAVIDAYLEIEKLRLGDRLVVKRDIDPSVLDAQVPPFLLQPLVENAVRHGIQPFGETGGIQISACEMGGCLLLRVSDTGPGFTGNPMAEERDHAHALPLLLRRLEAIYRSDMVFTVLNLPGRGVEASLRIPYASFAELSQVPACAR